MIYVHPITNPMKHMIFMKYTVESEFPITIGFNIEYMNIPE